MAKTSSAKRLLARIGSRRAAKSYPMIFRRLVAKEATTATKIEAIRKGIDARDVDDMVGYFHVSKTEIFSVLRTPASTTHRLIKRKRPLDAAASERVVRIADISRVAEEAFGSSETAAQWLRSPNLALANATPLSMLDTEPGASEVRRILASINYGGAL